MSDAAKRLFDVLLSFVGLLLVSPFLLLIAILIKLASPGPVLYRGVRVGQYRKPFCILKFRSMIVDAEHHGGSATAGDDPRLTSIGKFLRRYKLDELPQLFNVLKGEMSFVGPRPEVQKYVDRYSEDDKAILQLRPGITDWASIWNSNEAAVLEGSSDPEKSYEELILPTKIALQRKYLQDHACITDLKILFHTFAKLVQEDWVPKELESYGKVRRYRTIVSETSMGSSQQGTL
jgi:lipopolysaccharide/colanic/teichoic acid biosynthesis glycosyltransferase